MRPLTVAFAAAFGFLVCNSCKDHEIVASNYDQSCTQDSDCIAVSVGEDGSCGVSMCPNAAINRSSETRYESDVAANEEQCGGASPAVACGAYSILCRRNVCFLGAAPKPDAG